MYGKKGVAVEEIKRPPMKGIKPIAIVVMLVFTMYVLYLPLTLNESSDTSMNQSQSSEAILFTVASNTPNYQVTKSDRTATLDPPYLVMEKNSDDMLWESLVYGTEYVTGVDFDESGKYSIVYGRSTTSGLLHLYDQQTGNLTYTHIEERGVITSASISDDGNYIIYGTDSYFEPDENCVVVLFSTETMDDYFTFETRGSTVSVDGEGGFRTTDISADGNFGFAGYWDYEGDDAGNVILFDMWDGKFLWENFGLGQVSSVTVSDDSMHLAAGTTDGHIHYWDLAPYAKLPKWSKYWSSNSTILHTAISDNGVGIAAGGGYANSSLPGIMAYYNVETNLGWQINTSAATPIQYVWTNDLGHVFGQNTDMHSFGYVTEDNGEPRKFYDNEWDWVSRIEYMDWKETNDNEAQANTKVNLEAPEITIMEELDQYTPLAVTVGVIGTGLLTGILIRRRRNRANA
tara:strand:- start:233 stop:1609 length:1377 start_codon:yes stop_codon:yes gene_type:complete